LKAGIAFAAGRLAVERLVPPIRQEMVSDDLEAVDVALDTDPASGGLLERAADNLHAPHLCRGGVADQPDAVALALTGRSGRMQEPHGLNGDVLDRHGAGPVACRAHAAADLNRVCLLVSIGHARRV